MTQPRLTRIELQGFRGFGKNRQAFDLPTSISVLWGGNSQGKTSFVEALEFLFTGQIARRELLASTKDEFAEALRNAHIEPSLQVVVEAWIACGDGQVRRLSRTLVEDYRRGTAAGCVSRVEIDGKLCTEQDLESKLGLRLSHPPLRAPVLGQHALGYVFSASPTDRAAYFRAILDTQDLEDFRTAVVALPPHLVAPSLPALYDLAAVESIPVIASTVGRIRMAKTRIELNKHLSFNISALLASIGLKPESTLAQLANQLEEELERRRARTFPLALFGRAALATWNGPPATLKIAVEIFLTERGKIDVETQRLTDLFKAALALPIHPREHDPHECPLCGAADTFTIERIELIRSTVKATEAYAKAMENFRTALRVVDGQLEALILSVGQAQPKFMRETAAARRAAGFRLANISKLASDKPTVEAWVNAVRHVWRTAHRLTAEIKHTRCELQFALQNAEQWSGAETLVAHVASVGKAQTEFQASLLAYAAPANGLGELMKAAVDESTDTTGWEPLVRLSRDPDRLFKALVAAVAHAVTVKALEKAIAEIDAGNGKVLDEKFSELSNGVRVWWDRLRPDEPTFFSAVQRRSGKARRTIDLRVGLSASDDRSDTKFRDAIAVLSHSQLHCLGLSLFLARAVQERTGFIVLDDPVLTSDDDYRPHFVSSVIEGLLAEHLQVIICTQDHASWKDIGHRWDHRGAVLFQIVRNDPLQGTEIRSQSDDLATMLVRAQPFVKSQDPSLRKEGAIRLREAIERFCKIMLVQDRQRKGESFASITDYDGKNFGTYGKQVMNLLTKDPAHPGKLRGAHNYVTPGPHDDKPPSAGELAFAYGDLKKLKKDYLD
jgi:PAS domain-containing protein